MKISTKGRYALRVMADLAEHSDAGPVPLKEIAARQQLSQKYVESILPAAVAAGLVAGVHGPGGGYRLTRPPREITLKDILLAAEGDLSPVACLAVGAPPCPRAEGCRTLPVWKKLAAVLDDFFTSTTLADLIAPPPET